MSGDAPLLELAGITVRRGKTTVLESIDLIVESGEIIILVGENGAGKSTLIEAAAGILNLSDGTVNHSGQLVRDSEGRRNQPPPFGLTLQSGGFCQDELTRERIATAAAITGSEANSTWINELLSEWGLRHRSEDRIAWLSGGMKRKVGIIAGLTPALSSNEPRLILLDEPSEGLDDMSITTLKEQISTLAKVGHSFVIATHDKSLHSLATRTISIDESSTKEEEDGESIEVEDGTLIPLKSIEQKFVKNAANQWAAKLESRTRISTINRSLVGLITLAVIGGMLAQIPAPANTAWLALLALSPALISALVRPGYLSHLNDSRASDWWNSQLGRPLQMQPLLPTMALIPFSLALISIYFVFGEIELPAILIAISFGLMTFGAEKIHALESTLPRQGASMMLLILIILIWPFLLSVDLLTISSADFTGNEVWSQLLTTYLVPIVIWIFVPMIAPE
jgi:ABC-type multidrug transport system ATPase subunit